MPSREEHHFLAEGEEEEKITSETTEASRRIQESRGFTLSLVSEARCDFPRLLLPAPGDQSHVTSSQGARVEHLLCVEACGSEEATRGGVCVCVCVCVCAETPQSFAAVLCMGYD